jgi:putative ABC transport system permease protein
VHAEPGPGVLIALLVLVAVAVTASLVTGLRQHRTILVAAARAVVQLAAVALILTAVLRSLWLSAAFTLVMFTIAVLTTARRVGAPRAWPWAGAAMAAGVLPVLAIIFGARAVPLNGASLVPFAGIVIGGTMTAHSLAGRRVFAALREHHDLLEAWRSACAPGRPSTSSPGTCCPRRWSPGWTRPGPSAWSRCPARSSG